MSKCALDHCNLDVYESEDKCILHCKKNEYSVDFHKIGFLSDFYDELINTILEALPNDKFNKQNLEDYLRNKVDESSDEPFKEYLKDKLIIFNNVYFPQSKHVDKFEYTKVLKKLGQIHFNFCEFSISHLNLDSTECFFQDCKFHDGLSISNIPVLENESNVLFQQCEFNNKVTSCSWDEKLIIEASLFSDCSFTKIEFEETTFNQPIFNNSKDFQGNFEDISISECQVVHRFILNYHTIQFFSINDTVFENKLELKKAKIDEFKIINSNFRGLVDCYNSDFELFYISKSIFEEFVGFEYCHFGLTGEAKSESYCAKFEYATFLSFINFRNTKFYSGLDMSDANLKEYPNFLGTNIHPYNTNKETFRIIKHSFDKVGNVSEANKYFSFEMNKERKEVGWLVHPEKKIMLTINYLLSNFGQSYLVPLIWIFVFMIIHKLTVEFVDKFTIVEIFPKYHYVVEFIVNELNGLVKNISPIKRFLNEGMEFLSLFFYIAYSVLIYHFIVAVKRMTKR